MRRVVAGVMLLLSSAALADTVTVAPTGAVLCSTLSDAKLAYEFVSTNQSEKLKNPSLRCWYAAPGTQLVGLEIVGQYAWVAQEQGLISKGWTHVLWLQER